MRSVTSFNEGWVFEGEQNVRLPHTAVELPYSHFDERVYQRGFTYSRSFEALPDWPNREVSLVFDGAMANARVLINGTEVAAHKDGYTPFEARLTGRLQPGSNTVTVLIDGRENPSIPPFGELVDYLTYAGIYRDVWLRVTAPVFIASIKVETPDVLAQHKQIRASVTLANPQQRPVSGTLLAELVDAAGAVVADTELEVTSEQVEIGIDGLAGIRLWDLSDPALYTLRLTLRTPHGEDSTESRFGFREAEFTVDGFKLNGRVVKLLGLNRHQSFPYTGYAMGRAAQERDAEILKHELKLNMVRTSHYPQSSWFLNRCDELGLLVFEEIPGWQYIGGAEWQREAVENVRRMIRRDWNHPSIVIWGVRINESRDDHDFLRRDQPASLRNSTRRGLVVGCAATPTASCSKTSTR